MEKLNINKILDREPLIDKIKNFLINFEKNKYNLAQKRGMYVYGNPGSGKSTLIKNILKELNYDVITYDAGDIRNKSVIETITNKTMGVNNIISSFNKKHHPIAIIMDEIDGMNNGDKGGINTLIKLIRPKKTKKQREEDATFCPIICISNYHLDKKIKELMKVCEIYEVPSPNNIQISKLLFNIMPELGENIIDKIVNFLQGDLRKLESIYNIYVNQNSILKNEIIQNIFHSKSYNEDTKDIVKYLLKDKYNFDEHQLIMNETDRTIVGLLFHENVIDKLDKYSKDISIDIYLKILDNICFADYIDRITFQKQIWQFNEMTSLIKTFHNNKLLHEALDNIKHNSSSSKNTCEIRFTKVLTKYSTEYNNGQFILSLCQKLNMDKKDMLAFFMNLQKTISIENVCLHLETYEINKLDVARIYRYVNSLTVINNTSPDVVGLE